MSSTNNIYCVCRICLTEDKVTNLKNMVNFSIKFNEEKINFTQLYFDYTGISIETEEELSPYVCSKCETTLIIAFNFRKAVKESNDFLEHIFSKIQAFDEANIGLPADDYRGQKVMELKQKIFSQKYCRLCYMETDSLSNMLTSKYKSVVLHIVFNTISNLLMPKNDMSDCICKSCENQMIQIYDGRMNARRNDAYMKKSLAEAQKAIKEGKLDIEKYRIPRDQQDGLGLSSNELGDGLLEPEFIKLEVVDADEGEDGLFKQEDFDLSATPSMIPDSIKPEDSEGFIEEMQF